MEKYKKIDEKITAGYRLASGRESISACDAWLDAWEDIKAVMAEDNIRDVPTLEGKYKWTEFLTNYVQDLEELLHNAGVEDSRYISARIRYCGELLEVCGNKDALMVENTRRAIAESHFALGNKAECDRLFQKWLAEDPAWGWGHIGWADCYLYGTKSIPPDYAKAEEIISKALGVKKVSDRADVLDRAIEIYSALGNHQKVGELQKELQDLAGARKSIAKVSTPVTVIKTGRNDPCPCGSGKKYKKCCGGN